MKYRIFLVLLTCASIALTVAFLVNPIYGLPLVLNIIGIMMVLVILLVKEFTTYTVERQIRDRLLEKSLIVAHLGVLKAIQAMYSANAPEEEILRELKEAQSYINLLVEDLETE